MNNKIIICNNCSKTGHLLYQCKLPIISCGIVLTQKINDIRYYLMIRRKDSFGYIDFIYGKYNTKNIIQIKQKIDEMSIEEKNKLLTIPFDDLWKELRGSNIYKIENNKSKKKFDTLVNGVQYNDKIITLQDMINESKTKWKETEWEFPKGRKNFQEKDLDCALREFQEETGMDNNNMQIVENIIPYEEIFIGSNHKSYKHKYFIGLLKPEFNTLLIDDLKFQISEVSKVEWKTFDECLSSIRPYHLEKKNILTKINELLVLNNIYHII